jgi:hypothetical protein
MELYCLEQLNSLSLEKGHTGTTPIIDQKDRVSERCPMVEYTPDNDMQFIDNSFKKVRWLLQ